MSLGSDVRGIRSFKDTRHEVRRVEGNTNPSEETRPSPDTHSNVGVKDLS